MVVLPFCTVCTLSTHSVSQYCVVLPFVLRWDSVLLMHCRCRLFWFHFQAFESGEGCQVLFKQKSRLQQLMKYEFLIVLFDPIFSLFLLRVKQSMKCLKQSPKSTSQLKKIMLASWVGRKSRYWVGWVVIAIHSSNSDSCLLDWKERQNLLLAKALLSLFLDTSNRIRLQISIFRHFSDQAWRH